MKSINIELSEEEFKDLKRFKRKKETWKQFLFRGLWLKGCLLRKPAKTWKTWGHKEIKREKPCHKAGICPYGQLVEEFPITLERTEFSCRTFGHNCPVFYCAEPLTELKRENFK